MPFYAYRKDNGDQISFTHKIDWLTAVKSGNYSPQPLGAPPEPIKKTFRLKGEVVQDVEEFKNVDVDVYTGAPNAVDADLKDAKDKDLEDLEDDDKKPSGTRRGAHNKK